MTGHRVSAVVVRWGGGNEVDSCLRSLREHGGPELGRVVLVDSGSGDGDADRLAASFPDVDVIALPENRSFAWAADRGAARCDDPHLLLLNPDAELLAGAVSSLLRFLDQHPRVAGAVPLLVGADGSSQHRWQLRRLPTTPRLSCGLAGSPAFGADPPAHPAPVAQPAASAWLVRSKVWRALDGLDPEFAPAWWEDVDFCARLAQRLGEPRFPADQPFFVVPQARVVHRGGSSLERLADAEFLTIYHRNLLRYAARHRPRHLATIRAGLRLALLARALVRPSRRRAYLEALRAAP